MYFYEVAPLKIIRHGSATFTYHSKEKIATGTVVTIPVSKRSMTGIVWRQVEKPSYTTKNIEHIYYSIALPRELIRTAEWMSSFYSTPLATVLQTVLPRGLTKNRRTLVREIKYPYRKTMPFDLNLGQQKALQTIQKADRRTVLLHGVTGSGKTAVYVEYCRELVKEGKSAIILTPEISLMPQLAAEFAKQFKLVITVHSGLSEAERHNLWQRVLKSATPLIIIGPRSALFMPVKKLGGIIIDECHEPSFKQEQQPRYLASRVARILADQHNATLVLGSATPSVSDYFLAEKGGIITTLSERANEHSSPDIHVIDASKREAFPRNPLFSQFLIESMTSQLSAQKQILLFHNRRGTASSTLCQQCGWHAACERCLLPMTLHADEAKLRCHICGSQSRVPPHCPACHHADIIFKGVGTKRLADEVAKLFPHARIARFDGDSERGSALHEQYEAVYNGEINILIGTQLIAKGLDLPHLGLVGIVQADTGLMMPDFGARERTFQLIAQACGRVGRQRHTTHLIVQTFYPNDPVIEAGIRENYSAFYPNEIMLRKKGSYPPFIYLLKLVCAYKTESGAVRASRALAQQIRNTYQEVLIVGPTPAFYERLRGLYRWQIVVKSSSRSVLQAIANDTPVHWQAELDPYSLLS